MKTFSILPLCLAALCGASLATPSAADRLTPAQFARIKAAYVEAAPSMTDRLSTYRMVQVRTAYASHDRTPSAEKLTPQRLAKMRAAYDSLDRSEGFVLASN